MSTNSKTIEWKKNKLYLNGKSTGFAITPHDEFKELFYVVFPDKETSLDFYNKTRAKEHSLDLALKLEENEGIPQD